MRSTRRDGASLGALTGLFLALVETLCRYLPAVAGTDLAPDRWPALFAGATYVGVGAAAGALHRALGPLALLAAVAATADLDPRGLLAVPAAAGLGWLALRRRLVALAGIAAAAVGAVALPSEPPARPGTPARPDLVLVVLDTVAARDTSLHGASLDTTPALAALAAEGVDWRHALAPAPWTVPSHASLFTGEPARTAGAHHEHRALPEGLPTLAERLAELGYRTGAFAANIWLARPTGLTRGFAHQEGIWDLEERAESFAALRLGGRLLGGRRDKGGAVLVDRAVAWLERGGDTPSFLFLNLLEAHTPYHEVPDPDRFGVADPEAVGARVHEVQLYGADVLGFPRDGEHAAARALYAASVRSADDLLARLVAALRARGRLDRTALLATSDHGEAFGEHGFYGHVVGLHEETLHVPLVLRHPASAPEPRRVEAPVALERLYATLLEIARGEPVARSLFAELRGEPAEAAVVSEQRRPVSTITRFRSFRERDLSALDVRALRVRAGSLVLLRETPSRGGEPRFTFYDLAADPGGQVNRWPDARARPLRAQLEVFDRRPVREAGEDPWFTEDLRNRLKALGYLSDP